MKQHLRLKACQLYATRQVCVPVPIQQSGLLVTLTPIFSQPNLGSLCPWPSGAPESGKHNLKILRSLKGSLPFSSSVITYRRQYRVRVWLSLFSFFPPRITDLGKQLLEGKDRVVFISLLSSTPPLPHSTWKIVRTQ